MQISHDLNQLRDFPQETVVVDFLQTLRDFL